MTPALAAALLWLGAAVAAPAASEVGPEPESAPAVEANPASEAVPAAPDPALQELVEEVRALRDEVGTLRSALREQASPPAARDRVRLGEALHVPEGDVVAEATAVFGDLRIDGHVLGDAVSTLGDVEVGPTGRVGGDAVSVGGHVVVADGGTVVGNRSSLALTESAESSTAWGFDGLMSALYDRLVFLLAFGGAGVLVVALFPDRVDKVARAIDHRPLHVAFVGALWVALLVVAAVLFAVVIIGLPLSLLLIGVLGMAWMLGFVGLCQALGDRLPFRDPTHGRWLAFLLGALALAVLGAAHWVGMATVLAASLVGVGAAFHTRFGGRAQLERLTTR